MSFVTAIKDYIDLLNNVYDSVSGDITLQQLIKQTFLYIFSSIQFLAIYISSFQWLRDLTYLPIIVPQISTTIFQETYFLETPLSNFFTLLETPTYDNNKFIIGLLNSFFLCLPLSTTHLISVRRLLIQGIPAGLTSSIGTILGYTCFLFSVLFGLRVNVIPWLSYEPLSYIIGLFLTLTVVYDMAHEQTIRKFDWSQKSKLIQIFFINFVLTWTEQSCFFTYFGNLTLNPQPTILDNFSSITGSEAIWAHSSYLIGILLGSLFFTSFFIIVCLQVTNAYLKFSGFSYSRWLRQANFSLLTLIIAFTFTSIPFYSFDYLFVGSLGCISQDKLFEKTIFSSNELEDSIKLIGASSDFKSLSTDVTLFDRGNYLLTGPNESFEDLNYRGEYAWTARQDAQKPFENNESGQFISRFFEEAINKKSDITTLTSSQKESTLPRKTNYSGASSLLKTEKGRPNATEELARTQKDTLPKAVYTRQLTTDDEEFLDNLNNFESLDISSQTNTDDEELLDNLDNFESLDISSQNSGPSDYFFRLNDRINNDFKIASPLTPLLDISFSTAYCTDGLTEPDPELEKTIKQKYYSNPIYKLLLNADIDLFLRRQPSSYLLSPKEEENLFEKRLLLSDYYDSLRYYKKLPYTKDFDAFFNGSKSYADRVYNQQFKGTLRVVRRLFSITLNEEDNLSKNIILKFDQPLYKNLKPTNSAIGHEELRLNNNKNKPFIKLTNPIPFYTGWDEQLRKFVITNRLLSRSTAGYNIKFENDQQIKNYPTLTELFKNTKKVDFTMWPLPVTMLGKFKSTLTMPYTLLYEQLDDPQNKFIAEVLPNYKDPVFTFQTVPQNFKKLDPDQINDVTPPARGGFLWPGHSYLKINFKTALGK